MRLIAFKLQSLTKLNLESNMLKHLPAALQDLVGLTELNLVRNPLLTLDVAVMQSIGNSLGPPQGFCGSGEKGYLFSGSWGALLIILGELGSKHILLGI